MLKSPHEKLKIQDLRTREVQNSSHLEVSPLFMSVKYNVTSRHLAANVNYTFFQLLGQDKKPHNSNES